MQQEQLQMLKNNQIRLYDVVYNFKTNTIVRLDEETEWHMVNFNRGGDYDYCMTTTFFNQWETSRVDSSKIKQYIIRTSDGKREIIARGRLLDMFNFSPAGKYVIWYNNTDKAFYTYNVRTGEILDISKNIPTQIYIEFWPEGISVAHSYGTGFWSKNDEFVFIYDKYDIWKVDPSGKRPPVNITNGYGRSNKIMFRFVETDNHNFFNYSIKSDSTVVLCAFNEETKENGFF